MKQRYVWIDHLRLIAMISMICYHVVWDLVYLYGKDWSWYYGNASFVWQQSICWTFILLSGFCHSFCRRPFRQGILVSGAGLLVMAVTAIASQESRVVFGVLTLIGASTLVLIPLKAYFEKLPAFTGMFLMCLLFAATYPVNEGYFGFFGIKLLKLPMNFYRNAATAFWGFPYVGFESSDYFSMLPWSFLYFAGYFLYRIWKEHGQPQPRFLDRKLPIITWIGQHSLLIYLLHQPLIYAILELMKK